MLSGSGWSPSSIFLEGSLEREFTPFFLQMTARVLWGGPFPSDRAQDGPRGERTHLRPMTRQPNIIIIIIKDPQKREDGDRRGPAKTRAGQ